MLVAALAISVVLAFTVYGGRLAGDGQTAADASSAALASLPVAQPQSAPPIEGFTARR